jgi:hypothetical protein
MPKDTWKIGKPQEEREKRRYVKRGDVWEKGEARKREPSTEKERQHYRKRIDYSFQDWSKKDWDKVRSLRDMRMALDNQRDPDNRPALATRATLDQSRLTWEHVKGYTHRTLPDGTYTYQTEKHGTRARAEVLWKRKKYHKGQFLPTKYKEVWEK